MLPDAIGLCDVRHRGHPASLFAIGIDQGRDVKSGIENAAVFAFDPDLKAARCLFAAKFFFQACHQIVFVFIWPVRVGRDGTYQFLLLPARHLAER